MRIYGAADWGDNVKAARKFTVNVAADSWSQWNESVRRLHLLVPCKATQTNNQQCLFPLLQDFSGNNPQTEVAPLAQDWHKLIVSVHLGPIDRRVRRNDANFWTRAQALIRR